MPPIEKSELRCAEKRNCFGIVFQTLSGGLTIYFHFNSENKCTNVDTTNLSPASRKKEVRTRWLLSYLVSEF